MSDHPTSDDFERIEKLALGLVMNPKESWQVQPRLFVGKIPEHLPFEPPVPEHTEILGTLARDPSTVDIVLESQLSAEDIQSFYRMHLTALGWLEPDEDLPYHPGGFTHHPGPPPQVPGALPRVITFCHDSSGAGLTVIVHPQDDHTTRIRVELALESYRNRCRELARRRQLGQGMMPRVIPLLAPPPGAQQESQAAFGGYHGVFSAALLTTTLGLEAVAVHYGEQLRRAGWMQTDQSTRGSVAWQTWQFTSEEQQPWTGLFLALHMPEQPADYFLFLRGTLNAPPSTAPASGW